MDDSVREITSAIASGNSEAFARFYREWFDRAYADARWATGRDESFCLDVVQDAMMRVIRSIRAMATEQELRNWLRAVVTSCAYDLLRKEKRSRLRETKAIPRETEDVDDLRERLAWLKAELEKVDVAVHPMMVLRFRFGWTLERIGQVFGMKTGAIDGRIKRATEELKQRASESRHD